MSRPFSELRDAMGPERAVANKPSTRRRLGDYGGYSSLVLIRELQRAWNEVVTKGYEAPK